SGARILIRTTLGSTALPSASANSFSIRTRSPMSKGAISSTGELVDGDIDLAGGEFGSDPGAHIERARERPLHEDLPAPRRGGPDREVRDGVVARGALGERDLCGVRDRVVAHGPAATRSEEHTSELQSRENLVCRLLLDIQNYCID